MDLKAMKAILYRHCQELFPGGENDGIIPHQITFLGENFDASDGSNFFGYHCEQDKGTNLFDVDSACIWDHGHSASQPDDQFTEIYQKKIQNLNVKIQEFIDMGGIWDWKFK